MCRRLSGALISVGLRRLILIVCFLVVILRVLLWLVMFILVRCSIGLCMWRWCRLWRRCRF